MPVSALSHLIPEARKVADLADDDRVNAIQRDRWINYSRATEALDRLERLLQTPKRERMPCMVMHGDSNIGKTLIIAKFMRNHPPALDKARGVEQRDIIAMQMPATPDQHRFYSALLYELNAPFGARASVSALEHLARGLLRQMNPKMLVVDGGLPPAVRKSSGAARVAEPAQVPGERPEDQRRAGRHVGRAGRSADRRADEQSFYAVRDPALAGE